MLEDIKKRADEANAANQAAQLARAATFHRAFQQNEDGRKIYHGWIQQVLNAAPSVDPDELMRREGFRAVVKQITDNISIIEERSEHG